MSSISKIQDYHDLINSYNPNNNSTRNMMTKYEKVKMIGLRAEQLQRGATPYVEFDKNNFDPYLIAEKELVEKKIPMMVSRKLSDGTIEYWRVEDLIIT